MNYKKLLKIRNKISKILILSLFFLLFFATVAEADTIPCAPKVKGLHYTAPTYDYSPVLFSNMPYDIMISYLIVDSILKHSTEVEEFVDSFLARFNNNQILPDNDTLNYAYKYLYKIMDYSPLLFWDYMMNIGSKKIRPYFLYNELNNCIEKSSNGLQKRRILRSFWILHIYVDTTVLYDNSSPGDWIRDFTMVYSKVLDTIKGQILPNLNTAFVATGLLEQNLNKIDSQTTFSGTKVNILPNVLNDVNLVFDYCNQWMLAGATDDIATIDGEIIGTMKDKDGNPWIKPKREYIVLLAPNYECTHDGQFYYALWPVGGSYSHGMYPIENGNVMDDGNVWGWGTSVPVEVFKQNLNALIDEMNNYGE